ncbi:hypothetical protein [Spongiactinospora gelatinilytica]|uniref:hypothetical protein n=1 Tax=Spongiactinospora gelatinilytica TaxID=2666298 RepID=UPI0011B93C78|nr:hypothetical protein [Spongiactinospora gelatinilytica]
MSDGRPRDVLVVWEVDAGTGGAGGVTDDAGRAEKEMVHALEGFPEGRGRVREARLSAFGVYVYGETVVTARRTGGGAITLTGDMWNACDAWDAPL